MAKTIMLHIHDDTHRELVSAVITKKITASFYGTHDEFLDLVLKAIDKGYKEVTIEPKKKKK